MTLRETFDYLLNTPMNQIMEAAAPVIGALSLLVIVFGIALVLWLHHDA